MLLSIACVIDQLLASSTLCLPWLKAIKCSTQQVLQVQHTYTLLHEQVCTHAQCSRTYPQTHKVFSVCVCVCVENKFVFSYLTMAKNVSPVEEFNSLKVTENGLVQGVVLNMSPTKKGRTLSYFDTNLVDADDQMCMVGFSATRMLSLEEKNEPAKSSEQYILMTLRSLLILAHK